MAVHKTHSLLDPSNLALNLGTVHFLHLPPQPFILGTFRLLFISLKLDTPSVVLRSRQSAVRMADVHVDRWGGDKGALVALGLRRRDIFAGPLQL